MSDTFNIDEVIGLPRSEVKEITDEATRLMDSDLDMKAITKEFCEGCKPRDVYVGFQLGILLFKNERRLLSRSELRKLEEKKYD